MKTITILIIDFQGGIIMLSILTLAITALIGMNLVELNERRSQQ